MMYLRRPSEQYDNGSNIRVSAVCGLCHTYNYILIKNDGQIVDFCEHNITQNINRNWFEFTNDRRSRRARD